LSKADFWQLLNAPEAWISARASPTPHNTLRKEQNPRFIAWPFSALVLRSNVWQQEGIEVGNYFSVNIYQKVLIIPKAMISFHETFNIFCVSNQPLRKNGFPPPLSTEHFGPPQIKQRIIEISITRV